MCTDMCKHVEHIERYQKNVQLTLAHPHLGGQDVGVGRQAERFSCWILCHLLCLAHVH